MTKLRTLLALSSIAAIGLTSCRSVRLDPTGDMVAVYQFGQFSMLLNCDAPTAAQAVQKAVQTFDLYVTRVVNHSHDSDFEARARNDQKVTVTVAEVNRAQTLLRIRWGEGGDLVMSRRLYEAIEGNLAH